ncbi:MAG: MFS transporter [Epsilonproteobacteria bacterium]|nr:MAG: MFS transporter [Campylobacteraceae bacterium 4484_166]RLA74894.1 MAG: MFS transporter [Campylobacterota bacterium]
MFKYDRKIIFCSIVFLISSAVLFAKKGEYIPSAVGTIDSHPTIDGGVYHPVKDSKTGPYRINEKTLKGGYKFGRKPTKNELKAWDTDIMADGTGLPDGSGTVEDGEELYEAQCVSCHGDFGSGGGGYPALSKGNAYTQQKSLKNQRNKPDADGPVRVFGSYWPQASTLWWYIRDGMPHTRSKTLKDDEVYALVAYILNINEIKIDGKLVDDEYELTKDKFLKIKMPNADGFEPKIEGKGSLERVRKYYKNPKNFGAIKVAYAKRCMKNCQKKSAKIVGVRNGGISDFHPPLSNKKDKLSVKSSKLDVKKIYKDSCAMCHTDDSMGAPVAGKKADWEAKKKNGGIKGIYKRGIKGLNVMPPKGGAGISDDEFKKVVDYMINLK